MTRSVFQIVGAVGLALGLSVAAAALPTPAAADTSFSFSVTIGGSGAQTVTPVVPRAVRTHPPRPPVPLAHMPRRVGPQVPMRIAPIGCLVQGHGPNGPFRGYRPGCLNAHAPRLAPVPAACRTRVRIGGGFQVIYGATCLQQNGWTLQLRLSN